MLSHCLARLLALIPLTLGTAVYGHSDYDYFLDEPGARQSLFKDLVSARSDAISAAFPGFVPIAGLRVAIGPLTNCSNRVAYLACYDAAEKALTFDRKVLSFTERRLLPAARDYWLFYERAELREQFPIIAMIDGALLSVFMNDVATKHDLTWPHEGCGSAQLAQRLGCEMLLSGIDSQMRFKHSRMYNANRVDRLWPDDLTALKHNAWRRGSREYGEVRDLGGIQLLQPLVEEFGAARVFAYVAQTPFSIENDNVKTSALRYQERARSALGW